MATVSGCSASGDIPKPEASIARRLAPAPIFMAPVSLPDIPKGADARVIAGQQRKALVDANRRLSDSRMWYSNEVKEFAQ